MKCSNINVASTILKKPSWRRGKIEQKYKTNQRPYRASDEREVQMGERERAQSNPSYMVDDELSIRQRYGRWPPILPFK